MWERCSEHDYSRNTVKVNTVTVIQKWYVTLRHPKMHPHTKFGISTSNNVPVNKQSNNQFTVSHTVKANRVTVIQKWFVTLRHPKMHPHTKFWIPTSNNVGEMLRTRLFKKRGQCHSDPKMVNDTAASQDASTHLWDS